MQQTQQNQEEQEVCAICLEPVTHDYIQPKCKHQFHYECMHKVDMAHRIREDPLFYEEVNWCTTIVHFDTEKFLKENIFSHYSVNKEFIDSCDADDPLNCPLCRAPMSIRNEKIINKKKSRALQGKTIKQKKSKNESEPEWIIYDEPPIRVEKYKSQKGRGEKMTYRRFNK